MCGLELANMPVRGCRRDEVSKREVPFEAAQVEFPVPAGTAIQRLYLAGEVQRAVELRIKQRLLAQPIASQEKLPARLVVHGKREHPLEPFDRCRAVLLVRVQDDLGI